MTTMASATTFPVTIIPEGEVLNILESPNPSVVDPQFFEKVTILNIDWKNAEQVRSVLAKALLSVQSVNKILQFKYAEQANRVIGFLETCVQSDVSWNLIWWAVDRLTSEKEVTVNDMSVHIFNEIKPVTDTNGNPVFEAVDPVQILFIAEMVVKIIQFLKNRTPEPK